MLNVTPLYTIFTTASTNKLHVLYVYQCETINVVVSTIAQCHKVTEIMKLYGCKY